tara:strand:+ start:162 stop:437 length:276 start_codon:yes stop_codon:yes gene_type:complete
MANQYKCINNEMIELTDDEQAELNKLKDAYVEGTELKAIKRLERNALLVETDWMACSDYTMTDAWKTYRQALRDLPAQSGFPNVDFPTKPS